MNYPVQGRRVYPQDNGRDFGLDFEPGDYGLSPDGDWLVMPPEGCPAHGNARLHDVIENPDGTITVSPSIAISFGPNPAPGYEGWHGYLRSGFWTLA